MKASYLETVALVERLHRLFLEVVKCELDTLKIDDINNVQALILYNLGGECITIGELTARGCYLGSNVSYNLKKMIQNEYIEQCSSKYDKRSTIIKLSAKGKVLYEKMDAVFDSHIANLSSLNGDGINFENIFDALKLLEGFWQEASAQKFRFRK